MNATIERVRLNGVASTIAVMNYVAENPDARIKSCLFEFDYNDSLIVSRAYQGETESVWKNVDLGLLTAHDCNNGWERIYSHGAYFCRNKKLNILIWITK